MSYALVSKWILKSSSSYESSNPIFISGVVPGSSNWETSYFRDYCSYFIYAPIFTGDLLLPLSVLIDDGSILDLVFYLDGDWFYYPIDVINVPESVLSVFNLFPTPKDPFEDGLRSNSFSSSYVFTRGLYFFSPDCIDNISRKCFCYLKTTRSSLNFLITESLVLVLLLRFSIFLISFYFSYILAFTWAVIPSVIFLESIINFSNFSLSSSRNFLASSSFSYSIWIYSLSLSFSSVLELIEIYDINIFLE